MYYTSRYLSVASGSQNGCGAGVENPWQTVPTLLLPGVIVTLTQKYYENSKFNITHINFTR